MIRKTAQGPVLSAIDPAYLADNPGCLDEFKPFKPCIIQDALFRGDTELVMQDCVTIWDRWDEKTQVGRDENGLLVAVRLLGFADN